MNRFSRFIGSGPGPGRAGGAPEPERLAGTPYKRGDFIGQRYEVYGVLGKGGFGVVYLIYSHETKGVYALKTFRDEYLHDEEIRRRFRREAEVWVELERHPYLVRAYVVEEISGRLYIALEYIAPNERGLNSLEGYLEHSPPDLAQSLRWAIQCCHGLEYTYSRGVRAHRDLKPSNILIASDKTAKVTDFGLAGVLGESRSLSGFKLNISEGRVGLSMLTAAGAGFGTPPYMAPEQFVSAASCDERSDLYAFGVVLFQLASQGRLPFVAPLPKDESEAEQARYWREMRRLHEREPLPRLDSPLAPVISRCLEKDPAKRYPSFAALRGELEPLLERETGETIALPEIRELEAWEWVYKGVSLHDLGRHEEAPACFDRALELDPGYGNAWLNKGVALDDLGRHEEALVCYDRALELDPRHAFAWIGKGVALDHLGRREQALACYDRALELDPRNAFAWNNKGVALDDLGRHKQALACYDRALELDPRYAFAWNNKGNALSALGRHKQALACYERALELDPGYGNAWLNKGAALRALGRREQALACYDRALELDPGYGNAWLNEGNSLLLLGRYVEALACFHKALASDPQYVVAWINTGCSLSALKRSEDAIRCFDRALQLDPQSVPAWISKAMEEDQLDHFQEAERAYQRFLELATAEFANQIEWATRRLRELRGI